MKVIARFEKTWQFFILHLERNVNLRNKKGYGKIIGQINTSQNSILNPQFSHILSCSFSLSFVLFHSLSSSFVQSFFALFYLLLYLLHSVRYCFYGDVAKW